MLPHHSTFIVCTLCSGTWLTVNFSEEEVCWRWSWTFRRKLLFFFLCEVFWCFILRSEVVSHFYSFSKYIEVWSTENSTEWLYLTHIPKFWKKKKMQNFLFTQFRQNLEYRSHNFYIFMMDIWWGLIETSFYQGTLWLNVGTTICKDRSHFCHILTISQWQPTLGRVLRVHLVKIL
jgi:hypothetical protein